MCSWQRTIILAIKRLNETCSLAKCLHEELRLRLENSILPKEFSDYITDELVEQVRSFFCRKVNVMVERVLRLHHRQQQQGEAVQLYFDGLKQIAANCQFTAAEYDGRIRDIFVAGLRKDQMLEKFYEKDDLLSRSLEQVFADALVFEGAKDNVLVTRDSYDQSVQFVDKRHSIKLDQIKKA